MFELCAENGGDPSRPGKKDPIDPVVWLAERPGEPSWASEFGRGRPGWHVECAAIATHYLGTTFDVQAGGRDLIFPHHEMSAAHAHVALDGVGDSLAGGAGAGGAGLDGASGGGAGADGEAAFARRYAHAGLVRLHGEKMSKSRGNLVFVSTLLAGGSDPMAVRLAIISHHYRDDWDWLDQSLSDATDRLTTWRAAVAAAGAGGAPADDAGSRVLAALRQRLADDLDAPGAIAVVDQWAAAALAGEARGSGPLIRDAVDALLGIAL
jgi:L-cysteine:1D-myo-inositol 2-amino-2-deoxy-alpha-D-glucopyranoside ligase